MKDMIKEMIGRLDRLSTPHLADACLRVGVPVRCAPYDLQAIDKKMHMAGRAMPARHYGSVDIFLEAMEYCEEGDVLVVDDAGRKDRSCVGDMVTRESVVAKMNGIVIFGTHRDNNELLEISQPVFSQGTISTGPLSVDPRPDEPLEWANVGEHRVTKDDIVVGDCDGVIFLPSDRLEDIVIAAEGIRDTEKKQADALNAGTGLREQLRFSEYLEKRAEDPEYGFREHLNAVGGAVEV